jgi:hypothetical protein
MNTPTCSPAASRTFNWRDDIPDYLLCALTALCGVGGFWLLYQSELSIVF